MNENIFNNYVETKYNLSKLMLVWNYSKILLLIYTKKKKLWWVNYYIKNLSSYNVTIMFLFSPSIKL